MSTIVSASTAICVSTGPSLPGICAILRALTSIGTAEIDEMICTDTLGVVLKTGNLNSPCKIRFEAVELSRTEAVYVYALSGAGLDRSTRPAFAGAGPARKRC